MAPHSSLATGLAARITVSCQDKIKVYIGAAPARGTQSAHADMNGADGAAAAAAAALVEGALGAGARGAAADIVYLSPWQVATAAVLILVQVRR